MADPATVFEMTPETALPPIGHVETLGGAAVVVRVDGAEEQLSLGSPLYQGDVLSTGDDAAIGVGLADGTTFSMAENGSITLDEMVYDPGTQEGSINVSVAEGVFTFVSGSIAKTDPEAMTIDTPVASIGIRGTQLGLDIADGEHLTVVMMEEEGGFVGEAIIRNGAGVQVLNTAHMGTLVSGINAAPSAPYAVPVAQLLKTFGGAMKLLPGIGDANDYGLDEASLEQLVDEALAAEPLTEEILEEEALDEETPPEAEEEAEAGEEELAEFDTAAGDEEPETPAEDIPVTAEELTPEAPEIITLETPVAPEPVIPPTVDEAGGRVETPTRVEAPVVTAFNIDPVAFDETAATAEDTAISGQLTAADVDQDTLTFEKTDPPLNGTVELAPDGTFVYTPNADFSGTDTFTFTVDDGQGGTDTATVTVDVSPVADQPTLTVENASYGTGGTGGEPGTQVLYGGRGEQTLVGGAGDDTLYGDQGADVLYGDFQTTSGGAGEVALDINASLQDVDMSETLSVTIDGVPDGATLSAGNEVEGIWTIEPGDLPGLTMTLPDDYTENFQLNVEATATETATGETVASSGIINVGYSVSEGGEGGGSDLLFGGQGDDTLYGGGGTDVLTGEQGADTLYGDSGDDVLSGGQGADTLVGGSGADTLAGGKGDDTLIGGTGEDTFVFGDNSGSDNILDYEKGETLRFEGEGLSADNISVANNGDHAVITFGTESVEVTVNNSDMADMSYSVTTTPDDAIVVTFDDIA